MVSETGRFRVWKIATSANNLDLQTLDTQSAAQASVLLDNLPGYPDNLTRGIDGKIWLGFVAQRTNILDRMETHHAMAARKVVLRLPRTWWPVPTAMSLRSPKTARWCKTCKTPAAPTQQPPVQPKPKTASTSKATPKHWAGWRTSSAPHCYANLLPKALTQGLFQWPWRQSNEPALNRMQCGLALLNKRR